MAALSDVPGVYDCGDVVAAEVRALEEALGRHGLAGGRAHAKAQLLGRLAEIFQGAAWDAPRLAPLAARSGLLRALREHLLDDACAVRAAALRTLRHALLSDSVVREVVALRLPHLVTARMEAAAGVWERVCALKLVGEWLAMVADGRSEEPVPRIFTLSLVSILENPNDELHTATLRVLCDAALVLPPWLVAECGGFACLAEALVDPAQSAMVPSLVATLLHALDELSVSTHPSIQQVISLRCLFSAYTGPPSEPAPATEMARKQLAGQWSAARRAITLMLRSATGLFALSADPDGLPALCQLLRYAVDPALLHALLELFAGVLEEFCEGPLCARAAARRCYAVPPVCACGQLRSRGTGARAARTQSFASELSMGAEATQEGAGRSPSMADAEGPDLLTVGAGTDALPLGLATLPHQLTDSDAGGESQEPRGLGLVQQSLGRGRSGIWAELLFPNQPVDLLEVYAGVVLRTLLACGLFGALGDMCMDAACSSACPDAVRQGADLLSDLCHAAAVLLPAPACEELQRSLQPIVSAAADFDDPCRRARAEEVLARLSQGEGQPSRRKAYNQEGDHSAGAVAGGGGTGASHLVVGQGQHRQTATGRCRSLSSPRRSDTLTKPCNYKPLVSERFHSETPRWPHAASPSSIREPLPWSAASSTASSSTEGLTCSFCFMHDAAGEPAHRSLLHELGAHALGPAKAMAVWGHGEDLHAKLKQTGVIGFSKDCSKWDWQLVHDLVSGPLRDPARLHEALVTKFFRRLLRYYSPRRDHGFGSLDWRPEHLPLARLGLLVLGLLLVHPSARQQHLSPPDSLFYGNSFPDDLAEMLSRELGDAPGGANFGSKSETLSPRWRDARGTPEAYSQSEILPRQRSYSDPIDIDRRKRSSRLVNPRSSHLSKPGGTPGRSAPASWRVMEPDCSVTSVVDMISLGAAPSTVPEMPAMDQTPVGSFLNSLNLPWSSSSFRPIPTRERAKTSLAREYAAYFGLMSASPHGVAMLVKAGAYQTARALCALPGKDYLVRILLPQLHYGFEENRRVLDEAMRVGSASLQLFAVGFLALVLDDADWAPPSVPVGLGFDVSTGAGSEGGKGKSHRSHLLSGTRASGLPRPGSHLSLASSRSAALSSHGERRASGLPRPGSQLSLASSRSAALSSHGERRNSSFSEAEQVPTPPTTPLAPPRALDLAPPTPATLAGTSSTPGISNFHLDDDSKQGRSRFSSGDDTIMEIVEEFDRWPWAIELLASAVLHHDQRVARAAVEALEGVCDTEEASSVLLRCWPGDPMQQERWPPGLRMLLLQTDCGFDLMQRTGWLEKDFCLWCSQDYQRYVDVCSALLSLALSPPQEAAAPTTSAKQAAAPAAGVPRPSGLPRALHKTLSSDNVKALATRGLDESGGGDAGLASSTTRVDDSSGQGLAVPVSPHPGEEGLRRRAWLCSVPWRPALHVERSLPEKGSGEAIVEYPLDAVVEWAVPHELRRRLEFTEWTMAGAPWQLGSRNELRVTAPCNVPIGNNGNANIRASMGIGRVNIDEVTSVFTGARDWVHVCFVEELPHGGGAVYELQRAPPRGVVWTFVVGLSSRPGCSGDDARCASTWQRGARSADSPPRDCRLTAVSWPLRLPEAEHQGLSPPPHFCAYVASTALGADFLRQTHFVDSRLLAVLGADPGAQPLAEVRAALWAAGQLGRTAHGLEMLCEYGVLPLVVAMASRTSGTCRWSLRGTAVFCLALIGSNPLAAERLEWLGWDAQARGPLIQEASSSSLGGAIGWPLGATVASLAPWLGEGGRSPPLSQPLPREPLPKSKVPTLHSPPPLMVDERSLSCLPPLLEATEMTAAAAGGYSGGCGAAATTPSTALPHAAFGTAHRRALTEMETLHNTVVWQKASKALSELRRQDAAIFLSVPLWWQAQRCIAGRYRHPLQVRRFIADLFSGVLRSREALRILDALPL